MSALMRLICCLITIMAGVVVGADALACTTTTTNVNLGSHSSYSVASASKDGSGSAGLSCNVTLELLTTHYVAVEVDDSSFMLTGPTGQTVSYTASTEANGPPLGIGNFQDLSSTPLLGLFSGTNNSIPLYFRTDATTGLSAGTYSGYMDLRWFYSVCNLGALGLCASNSNSAGVVRPLLGALSHWGTGNPVRINIEMTIEKDCIITAPDASFGTAPLASSFDPITRTILIRCSAGAAYTVGLSDGNHPDNGARRMRSGSHYLHYDIFKTSELGDRWGVIGSARRHSGTANANPGIYDSITTQGFSYTAAILPGQTTPPPGQYSDTILLDITF